MSRSEVLVGRVEEGSYWTTVLGSAFGHLFFLVAVITIPMLFPGTPLTPGSGGGGGGSEEGIIPIGLTDSLGGGAGTYKPTLKPQPPSVEMPQPKPSPADPEAIPLPDPLDKPNKSKKPKAALNRIEPKYKIKSSVKLPKEYVGAPTGPGAGGVAGLGSGPHGVGIGFGDGSEGGSGLGDSWYARQVERRIGQNWLRGLVGSVPPGKFTTRITFYVRDNGAIDRVSMDQSSGISSLDDSARRAIHASNPLTPLPTEMRGKPVKFTAVFEYPPPR
ncbi:MAG: TonB family protein [Acidobacteria bacterium]|nr:TonB family protein [Acidobacteriota bacterium]MBI3657092.1 TonB family protein [Acidobacteriota bacterium]